MREIQIKSEHLCTLYMHACWTAALNFTKIFTLRKEKQTNKQTKQKQKQTEQTQTHS